MATRLLFLAFFAPLIHTVMRRMVCICRSGVNLHLNSQPSLTLGEILQLVIAS